MTKTKQIKEIGDIIAKIIKRDCISIFGEDDDGEVEMISTISVDEIGRGIYESGYRKAEEVRKETAREVIKPYVCERFGKNEQTYSLKCGRYNKTVQTKWNYFPFCGAKLREVEE